MRKDGFDIDDILDKKNEVLRKKDTVITEIVTKDINKSVNQNEINDNKIINKINNKTNKNTDDNATKINNIFNIKKDLFKDLTKDLNKEETRGRKKSKNKKDKSFTSKLYGKQKETIDNIKKELQIETDYELLLFLLKKSTIRNNIDIDLFFIK